MEHLWTPWRSAYMKAKRNPGGCVFCHTSQSADDRENLVVHRAERNFIILNLYPYTSGHLMIAPFQHVSRLQQLDLPSIEEMMRLAQRAERILEETYKPQGLNLGMNLGEAAGAGIEQHIHLHVLPRWMGDSNFMTSVGETRIMPEDLAVTYSKLQTAFAQT